ncbi:MFS transporter [Cohnella endophytica]|uniref:MFS transporter n=1 Tax=Cohnella endophytica TaxID=2419778 RepID=A0A494Y8V7_9BACL|nr:MFS transporter [Cohnella endophytica]RKP58028.1 MFS transporter [Cohnella endophytica]
MLNNRYVRTIILSRVLLNLGIWVRNFAILLYVTDMTNNDPLYVSLISVAEFAPIFLFALIGGTFADRWKPKRTMIASDLLSSVSVFAVLFALIYGSWHALLFATLVSSSLSQFSQPSAMKIFKRHVPQEQLQGVMAAFQSMTALFMVIGPMIGTFIYTHYGIETSLAAMGMLFIGSGSILAMLPRDESASATVQASGFLQEMKSGLAYVRASRVLRKLGGAFAFSGLAAGLIQPLMIFVATESLGLEKSDLQWLLMANGGATLLAGAFILAIAKKTKPQILLVIGLITSTFGTVGVGFSTSLALSIPLIVMNGLCYPFIQVGIQTLLMKNTEGAYIGRVGGTLSPMFMGMMVVGMSLSGILKDQMSLRIVYGISALLFLAGALIISPLLREARGGKSSPKRQSLAGKDVLKEGQNG